MLLSHDELAQLVQAKVVENCPAGLINGASIDVTLAPKILVEVGWKEYPQLIDFRARTNPDMEERILDVEHGYLLQPGEFILASSNQIFNLPSNIACEYKLKSSMARIGLNHLNAGWCDPTWHGSALTLELVNTTRFHVIRLRPGDPIGQVVFFSCTEVKAEVAYAKRGRYNHDREVHPIKP